MLCVRTSACGAGAGLTHPFDPCTTFAAPVLLLQLALSQQARGRPGRALTCLEEQTEVYAPGSPKNTTFLPATRSFILMGL
jgi:hypothetical protein